MSIKEAINDFSKDLFVSDISLIRIMTVLLFATFFGMLVFAVYRYTVNNEFYSKDFNRSLAIMPIITAAIILTIQSNLVISLGMVGSLSIVRFRTAIKSSLDLLFLFWSISLGIICGASIYTIAIVLSLFVIILLVLIEKIESPVPLGLLVLECKNVDDSKKAIEEIKANTNFMRIKNETISLNNVEVVIEYKSKEKNLDKIVSNIKEIKQFSILNHDRENRI